MHGYVVVVKNLICVHFGKEGRGRGVGDGEGRAYWEGGLCFDGLSSK